MVAKKKVVKSFFSGFENVANSAHDVNKKKEGIQKKPKPFNIETSVDRKGLITMAFDQKM